MSEGAEQAVILAMVAGMLLCLFVGSVLSDRKLGTNWRTGWPEGSTWNGDRLSAFLLTTRRWNRGVLDEPDDL